MAITGAVVTFTVSLAATACAPSAGSETAAVMPVAPPPEIPLIVACTAICGIEAPATSGSEPL